MKLNTLIAAADPLAVSGGKERPVAGVTCDSRQVRPGYVFVAVPGHHCDGAGFREDAVKRGAVAVISQSEFRPRRDLCQVRVRDARVSAAHVAAAFYGRPADSLQMVGVTGTNGKTTVTYIARDFLRAAGRQPGLVGTVEYQIGQRVIPASRTTPEPATLQSLLAQMVAAGCRSAVMEVSSHALVQKRVEGIDYDAAVFTNLTRDHLDYHGDMQSYFEAKCTLFLGLGRGKKQAVALVNVDDPYGRRLADMPGLEARVITFGTGDQPADVRADEIAVTNTGSRFRVRTPWGEERVATRLMGRFNVSNALAAIASCGAQGIGLDLMAGTLSEIDCVPGRLQAVETRAPFRVFVDYAHTDDALRNVLLTLRELTEGRLLVVFGCGGDRDRTKRPAMGRVVSENADLAILTSDNPRHEDPAEIIDQIRVGFGDRTNFEIVESRRDAIARAVSLARRGDVLLVAGKGHETFQEFANKTVSFDDRQVVRSIVEG